jgi:hypothetical protein
MTSQDARVVLALGEEPVDRDEIRRSYLARVRDVRVSTDPEGFIRLRESYELLGHPGQAPVDEVQAARDALAAQPDATEARWRLLSYLSYAASPEAFQILCAGAERQPDAFVDELLFHFSEKVPGRLLETALPGAGAGRLLLVADVHAIQGRPEQALEALRAALATSAVLSSNAMMRLAIRSVLSLQSRAQIDAAVEALTMVKESRSTSVAMAGGDDLQTAAALQIAEDLARLGVSLPLDLRQAAALTAKRGDFENAPYAARFATRMMSSRAIRQLSRRLAQDAPTLAKVLRFDLTDEQLRPAGTPAFRLSGGWAGAIVAVFLQLCWVVHKLEQPEPQLTSEETIANVHDALLDVMVQECKAPWSEPCLRWDEAARPLANHAHPTPDPGLDPPMIGSGLPR